MIARAVDARLLLGIEKAYRPELLRGVSGHSMLD
jgi:hypothetical protein